MKQASNYRLKEDLERELESLVARMEAKGEQITRLKRHQQTVRSQLQLNSLDAAAANSQAMAPSQ